MSWTTTPTVSSKNGAVPNFANGTLTTSGTAVDTPIVIGFKPRYFKLLNITDRLQDEWYEGMIPDHAVHTAVDGTVSHSTSNGFTINDTATPFATSTAYKAGTILVDSAGLYYRVIRNSKGNGTNIAGLVAQGDAVACSDNILDAVSIIAAAEILITSKSFFWIAIG